MTIPIVRIILYVKDIPNVADFYRRHFGLQPLPSTEAGWMELTNPAGGCTLALHQAAKTQKSGAAVKIVFGVKNVHAFVKQKKAQGLKFGPIHRPGEFEFANTKDPAGNSIQVSSRAWK